LGSAQAAASAARRRIEAIAALRRLRLTGAEAAVGAYIAAA
jgi:hypothetical protein